MVWGPRYKSRLNGRTFDWRLVGREMNRTNLDQVSTWGKVGPKNAHVLVHLESMLQTSLWEHTTKYKSENHKHPQCICWIQKPVESVHGENAGNCPRTLVETSYGHHPHKLRCFMVCKLELAIQVDLTRYLPWVNLDWPTKLRGPDFQTRTRPSRSTRVKPHDPPYYKMLNYSIYLHKNENYNNNANSTSILK